MEQAGHQLYEDDTGFITFEVNQRSIHIHNLWVDPDYRHKGHGSSLVEKVIENHRTDKTKYLTAQVQLNSKNVTESLKAQLHYGFYVVGADENAIKLAKEI